MNIKKVIKTILYPFRWIHMQLWYHYHGMYQGYKPLTKENQSFNVIYNELRKEEEILQQHITAYGTGVPNAKLADIDESMKRIKAHLKECRELAIEYREEKEKNDDDKQT